MKLRYIILTAIVVLLALGAMAVMLERRNANEETSEPVVLDKQEDGSIASSEAALYSWYVDVEKSAEMKRLVKASKGLDGTYEIRTPEELIGFSRLSNGLAKVGDYTIPIQHFKGEKLVLENDLVFNTGDASEWTKDTKDLFAWTPIAHQHKWGNLTTTRWFGGEFDGQGHYISGLFTNGKWETTEKEGRNTGLFGHCYRAEIHDLVVVNSAFCNYLGTYTGQGAALIDKIEGCDVYNIYADVDLWSEYALGGIVAYAHDTGNLISHIHHCVYAGNMTVLDSSDRLVVGGILGCSDSSGDAPMEISDCLMLGTVYFHENLRDDIDNSFGGIVGTLKNDFAEIRDCFFAGTLDIPESLKSTAYLYVFTIAGGTGNFPLIADCAWDTSRLPVSNMRASYLTPLNGGGTNKGIASLIGHDTERYDWITPAGGYPMPKAVYRMWEPWKDVDFTSVGISEVSDPNAEPASEAA